MVADTAGMVTPKEHRMPTTLAPEADDTDHLVPTPAGFDFHASIWAALDTEDPPPTELSGCGTCSMRGTVPDPRRLGSRLVPCPACHGAKVR